jgi:hypothetical protein
LGASGVARRTGDTASIHTKNTNFLFVMVGLVRGQNILGRISSFGTNASNSQAQGIVLKNGILALVRPVFLRHNYHMVETKLDPQFRFIP